MDHASLAHSGLVEAPDSAHGLRCAHFNVNGLYNKLEEIKLILNETKMDIFAITKTHLGSDITNPEININGYSFARRDRSK